MGKSRHKSRRPSNGAIVMMERRPQVEPHWQLPARPARSNPHSRALPLNKRAEPLVRAAKPALYRHEPSPADDIPIPRNRALAVPRSGILHELAQWFWSILPKKPRKAKQAREVELTRRKLKDLRRQISVMEKTLGRLS